jgi:hypothetical protein
MAFLFYRLGVESLARCDLCVGLVSSSDADMLPEMLSPHLADDDVDIAGQRQRERCRRGVRNRERL